MVQDTCFGKMCREHSVPIMGLTLPMFLALWSAGAFLFLQTDGKTAESQSAETDGDLSNGVCWTLKSSEFPNDVVESSLSSILERGGVDSRFYLSKRACEGILRRANNRGKELPQMLKSALINQARECNYGEEEIANTGKIYKVDKGSSGSAIPILNFQGSKGNSVADVSDTMYSLNAMHGHDVHCVVDINAPGHSTESRSDGEGVAEGAAGSVGESCVYENHAQDSRVTESVGVCPTLHSQMGTGGGNVPFVLTPLLK